MFAGVLLMALAHASASAAATITINTAADEFVLNGNCSLREAIFAANTNATFDACAAGNGPDTIVFHVPVGSHIVLNPLSVADDDVGVVGDLDVFDDLEVAGPGADKLTIRIGSGPRSDTMVIFDVNSATHLTVRGITIGGDDQADCGVGLRAERSGSALTVEDSIVQGCRYGFSADRADVTRSTVRSNEQGFAGGRLVVFTDSTIVSNGAGIVIASHSDDRSGMLIVSNSTVAFNGTGVAGDAFHHAGTRLTINLFYNTIAGNGVGVIAGGSAGNVDVQYLQTILANDTNCEDAGNSTFASIWKNLLHGPLGACSVLGPSDIVADPLLAGYVDPGPPGRGFFPLQAESPAIDAAGTWGGFFCSGADQIGNARTADGDGDGIPECDIGAIEYIPFDRLPAVMTAIPSELVNRNGWYRESVDVNLTALDTPGGSGAREIVYQLDGAERGGATVFGTEVRVPIAAEGLTTLTFFARDNAGNESAPETLDVRIDPTPPLMTCAATPDVLWPPDHSLRPVRFDVTVEDALSGPGGWTLGQVRSSEPDAGTGPGDLPDDIQGWEPGTPDADGWLRAEHAPRGRRTYAMTARGLDLADNPARCLATVVVPLFAPPPRDR